MNTITRQEQAVIRLKLKRFNPRVVAIITQIVFDKIPTSK